MNNLLLAYHLAVMLVAPIFLVGIINRVKALWSGRRGPRLDQFWYDLKRLLSKTPVYSEVTSWIFPLAPLVVLATTVCAALMSPILPGYAPFGFPGDFIAVAYLLGLGKVFLILGALDTGSAFEGMGASREATYSALTEPVLLLGVGTLGWISGLHSFQDLVVAVDPWSIEMGVRVVIALALFVVLLVESSRVPADDPTTHLELTMVHEVMILDHSGPELATVQYASGIKMTLLAGLMSAVLNPFRCDAGGVQAALGVATSTGLMVVTGGAVGLVESLTARLRFKVLPAFIFAAFVGVLVSLAVVLASKGAIQ